MARRTSKTSISETPSNCGKQRNRGLRLALKCFHGKKSLSGPEPDHNRHQTRRRLRMHHRFPNTQFCRASFLPRSLTQETMGSGVCRLPMPPCNTSAGCPAPPCLCAVNWGSSSSVDIFSGVPVVGTKGAIDPYNTL